MIDKPAGWTSHDVVAKSRGVIGTGRSAIRARSIPTQPACWCSAWERHPPAAVLTELPKRYEGEIVLGTETTTLDAAGEITATHDMSAVTDDQVRAAANRLTGI